MFSKDTSQPYTLYSHLQTLPHATTNIVPTADKTQDKKQARLQLSLEHTTHTRGFLHAVLLQIADRHILLAGPSGVGKTAYARYLADHRGAVILAQDWVAVERIGEDFYVSDLNFKENLLHQQRCKLSSLIFLTAKDYRLDAFCPNTTELHALLAETFDTASPQECHTLERFWLHNQSKLSLVCAVPARLHDESYTMQTLLSVYDRTSDTTGAVEVGVIGLGALGSELAFQLGQLPFVKKVHLFNRTTGEATSYALDMNQAHMTDDPELFVAHNNPEDVFTAASSIFLAFRESDDSVVISDTAPERWKKLYAHLPIAQAYARIASQTNFQGTLFMLTNPVDILSYALYTYSQKEPHPLRTYQVYGVGLELEIIRAFEVGRKLDPTLRLQDIKVYGNHADDYEIISSLSEKNAATALAYTKNASLQIREHVPRTVYGPIGATLKTFTAYHNNTSTHLTMVRNSAFAGHDVAFRRHLPQLPETLSVGRTQQLLAHNQGIVAQYRHLL